MQARLPVAVPTQYKGSEAWQQSADHLIPAPDSDHGKGPAGKLAAEQKMRKILCMMWLPSVQNLFLLPPARIQNLMETAARSQTVMACLPARTDVPGLASLRLQIWLGWTENLLLVLAGMLAGAAAPGDWRSRKATVLVSSIYCAVMTGVRIGSSHYEIDAQWLYLDSGFRFLSRFRLKSGRSRPAG